MQQFDDNKVDDYVYGSGHQTMEDELLQDARVNFIKKVYSILAMQLLVTSSFVALSTFNEEFREYQQTHMGLFWVCFLISLASLLTLGCVRGITTKTPANMLLLIIFTLSESYLVSMICGLYTPESVLNATVATLGATISLTCYAIYTKTDFTQKYSVWLGFFWSFFGVTFFLTLLNIFIIQSEFLYISIAIAIGAVYSLYLIIDIQLILGGRNKELTLDNYILGAILLYIDIIQLFLQFLKILGKSRK